jgi:hypothetical protein
VLPWFLLYVLAVVLLTGYYLWRPYHERLQQTIEVTQARRHTWDRQGQKGVQYYFGVVNKSDGMTINDVRVQLKQMVPEIESISWLPIILHQQHDNPPSPLIPYAKSFNLHPSEPKHIDLLSGIDGQAYFNITHVVPGVDASVQMTGRHRLQVMIIGDGVPVVFAWFAVWMDEAGVLQCEMEQTT